MRNIFITLILFNCISLNTFSQTILKGKKLTEHLLLIDREYSNGNFENAINLFYSAEISEDLVRKKDFDLYFKVKSEIETKKQTLDSNKIRVQNWISLYNSKKYEELNDNFSKLEKLDLYPEDFKEYSNISQFLEKWKNELNEFTNKYIVKPKEFLNNYFFNDNQYNLAKIQLDKINQTLLQYDNIQYPEGDNPKLKNEIEEIQKDLSQEKSGIENYLKEHKPLTLIEKNNLIQSNNVSISQIMRCANNIEYGYDDIESIYIRLPNDNSLKIIDTKDIISILNIDVVNYYGLDEEYDSELKRKVFSQTSDYKSKYKELKQIHDYIMESYFYMSVKNGCFYKYDMKLKSFKFRTSSMLGVFLSFYSYSYLQFDDLCLSKPNNFKFDEGKIFGGTNYFIEQNYFVPVPQERTALEIEENCDNINLMFIFKLSSVKTSNSTGISLDYIIGKTHQVILYNSKNDKIYSRYTYK